MGLLLHFWLSKLNKQNCLAKFSNFMRFLRNVRALKSHTERVRERSRERERHNEIDGCSALNMNRQREREDIALIFGATVMQSLNLPFGDQCLLPATIDQLPLPHPFRTLANLCLFWLRIVAKNTRNSIRIGEHIKGGRSRLLQTFAVFPNWEGSFLFSFSFCFGGLIII